MRKPVIGVMGPGETAQPADLAAAYEVGQHIARAGWILLTGGRNIGVMEAASQGAKEAGGTTVGILPNHDPQSISQFIDIPIMTDLGSARNNINVLSSDVIIACGIGLGTISEVALALKAGKQVIWLNLTIAGRDFFQSLSPELFTVDSPAAAVSLVQQFLQ